MKKERKNKVWKYIYRSNVAYRVKYKLIRDDEFLHDAEIILQLHEINPHKFQLKTEFKKLIKYYKNQYFYDQTIPVNLDQGRYICNK